MQNNSLRRIMSALLTLVLVVCTMLSDLVLPDKAGLFTKEVSAAEYLRGTLGITSDYIKNHLNEAAADQVAIKEDGGILQKVFGEVTAYADDAYAPTILNGGYDENGLGMTYHYVLLNYSLADSAVCYPGMTVSDLWQNHPENFIASIYGYSNVYALEGVDDYYVAFVNPGQINTMGSAISADFTNGDNEKPVVYNDRISFDAASGIIYIPKSFYYENGEEVVRHLTAQVLVPYTFTSNNSSLYQLVIENEQPGVSIPAGVSAQTAQPFDVTMSFQIATPETAGAVDVSKIRIYLNDDAAALDMSGDTLSFDKATGYLTIAQSASTVYSVRLRLMRMTHTHRLFLTEVMTRMVLE